MADMKSWKLEAIEDSIQTKEYDSFIGGKPKLPPDTEIPKCELCGKELTFLFQAAFPHGHVWAGKSMAVFYCVESWHGKYCIPELPQKIAEADISEEFLSNYERNFRILLFDTSQGEILNTYQEKVAFRAFRAIPKKQTRQEWDFVIGGRPVWVMGKSEKPRTIAGTEKTVLLLQVKEDYHFRILPDAPKAADPFAPDGLSVFPWYYIFAANRVYFWGAEKDNKKWVYIAVQH